MAARTHPVDRPTLEPGSSRAAGRAGPAPVVCGGFCRRARLDPWAASGAACVGAWSQGPPEVAFGGGCSDLKGLIVPLGQGTRAAAQQQGVLLGACVRLDPGRPCLKVEAVHPVWVWAVVHECISSLASCRFVSLCVVLSGSLYVFSISAMIRPKEDGQVPALLARQIINGSITSYPQLADFSLWVSNALMSLKPCMPVMACIQSCDA